MTNKKKSTTDELPTKTIAITGAKIKDVFCNYSYELLTGPTEGDECHRDGVNIIHDDLRAQFKKLNVHLAAICEQIDINKIQDIDALQDIDLNGDYKPSSMEAKVKMYFVNSFRLKGTGENAGVTLSGTRILSTGEILPLNTPTVKWDDNYLYVNELRAAIDGCIEEVEEYMNGKCHPKLVQQEMDFDDKMDPENSNQ